MGSDTTVWPFLPGQVMSLLHGVTQLSAVLGNCFWVKISSWMYPASRAHSHCSFIAVSCSQPFAGLSQPGWKLLEGRDAVFAFYSLSCMEHSILATVDFVRVLNCLFGRSTEVQILGWPRSLGFSISLNRLFGQPNI